MDQKLFNRVKEYIAAHEEDVQNDLFELVRIPSVTGEPTEGAPFGEACLCGLSAAVELFRRNGFDARVCGNGMYGLVTYGAGEKSIGIFAHTDVVGVGDDWQFTKPFEPVRIGDTLVGRGVMDNKAGVIGALYLLKALRNCGIRLRHGITVFLGAEEENGMRDIESFVENEEMPSLSFVPDNSYPLCIGEKTIRRLWLRSDRQFEKIMSIEGGIAYNVILDRISAKLPLSAELETDLEVLTAGNDVFSVTREGDVLTVKAHGVTAHTATPQHAVNATKLLCDLLVKADSLPENDRAILSSASALLADYNGASVGIPAEDPVFGKLTAANGMAEMRNGCFAFSLDIRYGARQDDEKLYADLENHCRKYGFVPEGDVLDKGILVDPDDELVHRLRDVYRTISGDKKADCYISGGGTYARKLVRAFSIGTSVPWCPVTLELPMGHGSAHQSDEAISLPGLLQAILVNTMMIVEGDALAD